MIKITIGLALILGVIKFTMKPLLKKFIPLTFKVFFIPEDLDIHSS